MYFYDVYLSPNKELIGHYLCLNYITYVADTGSLMLPGEYKKKQPIVSNGLNIMIRIIYFSSKRKKPLISPLSLLP